MQPDERLAPLHWYSAAKHGDREEDSLAPSQPDTDGNLEYQYCEGLIQHIVQRIFFEQVLNADNDETSYQQTEN